MESLREVLLHRAKWIVLAGFWRNVRDYLLIGHGLMVMECWWNQWRFWGIDGNKVWSLGFLKRRRGVRDSFLVAKCRHTSRNWTLGGSRRPCPKTGPHWGWPRFGRPIGRSTQSGPQLARVNWYGRVLERYDEPSCTCGLYGSF